MALVKCRECGHEVSSEAKSCPQCGIKGPAPAVRPAATGPGNITVSPVVAGIVILLLVGVAILVMYVADTHPPPEEKGAHSRYDSPYKTDKEMDREMEKLRRGMEEVQERFR